MDASACAVKRKKRRTRKCLDEIRKRSRHNSVADVSENVDKSKKSSKTTDTSGTEISSHTHNISNITTKRLTLNPSMLSKTVKSETITRAVITSKNQEQWSKPVLPGPSVNAAVSISSQESTKDIARQPESQRSSRTASDTSDSESLVIANEIEEISFHDDSDRENVSPKSLILLSPISRAIPGGAAAAVSRASSPAAAAAAEGAEGARPRLAHRLYAECVRELPARMHQRSAAGSAAGAALQRLARRHVMDAERAFLRGLYAQTCRLETEGNLLRDIGSVARALASPASPAEPPKIIVENPREYLSMGAQRRSAPRELHGSRPRRVATPPSSPPLPREPSPAEPPAPQLSLINDTPEYTYYPRKLNQ